MPRQNKYCMAVDCGEEAKARGYCHIHYYHAKKNGWPILDSIFTIKQPKIENGYAKIPLGVDGTQGFALVDIEDAEMVSQHNWYITSKGYAHTNTNKVSSMHQLVNGKPPKGFVTDHKNQNRLDNRKENLRITTYSVNKLNSKVHSNNKYGYAGIAYRQSRKQWRAYLTVGGVYHEIGCGSLADAIEARKELENKYLNKEKK